VLTENAERWTQEFLDSGKARPEHKRYRHRDIVDALLAIGQNKCFYCEAATSNTDGEIDHRVDVAADRSRAYDWSNLCWSCRGCNRKLSETSIAASATVDPTGNEDPRDHLRFEDEQVLPREHSERGRQTIAKYKLNRQDLQLQRARALKEMCKRILGRPLDDPSVERVFSHVSDTSWPFSAMFRDLIEVLRQERQR
jgi:uncharacterized protein (TIGR02646 family)